MSRYMAVSRFFGKFLVLALVATSTAIGLQAAPVAAAVATEAYLPSAAYAAAKKSGKAVEILSLKTPTTAVWAEPSGRTSADIHAVPVRLKRNGQWLDYDMTLQRRPDGTVAPKVHPKDLVLSGAVDVGEHDLATVVVNGERVGMGWRGRLPEPRLRGDTAIYPDVLPGVDLTVKAHSGGFEQFFVVKERTAAAHVAGLHLPLRTGKGAFSAKPDGTGEWLGPNGSAIARMPLPLVWDAKAPGKSGERPRQSRMGMSLKASAAELAPDLAWFNDPQTEYPVTVDPGLVVDVGAGFDEFVQNTISISDNQGSAELKVGYSDSSDCLAESSQGCRTRSYLRFDNLAGYKGVRLYSARLYLWEFHSWSCTSYGWRATRTDSVSGSVQWGSEPAWRETASTTTETKGYSSSCNDGWVSTDIAALVDAQVPADNGAAADVQGLREGRRQVADAVHQRQA